jgi:diguanylate cyclase (GGDEF)-like protein
MFVPHQPTLLMALGLVALLATLMLAVSAVLSNGKREGRIWACANLVMGIGYLLTLVNALPFWIHAWLGYGVVAAGLGLLVGGFWVFTGHGWRWEPVLALAALGLLGAAWFALFMPNALARQVWSAALTALVCTGCAVCLWRWASPMAQRSMRITSLGFGLVALLVWGWLLGDAAPKLLGLASLSIPAEVFAAFTFLVAQVVILMGLMLMLAQRHAGSMERAALTDALTGIHNRAGFTALARRRMARAQRTGVPLALMLVDIDYFKRINDTHGHAIGDEVLRYVVRRALRALRPEDLMGRWGGEEFAVLLVGLTENQARAAAERLRRKVAKPMRLSRMQDLPVTLSAGVAHTPMLPGTTPPRLSQLLRAADAALYRAKGSGRNNVQLATANDRESSTWGSPET